MPPKKTKEIPEENLWPEMSSEDKAVFLEKEFKLEKDKTRKLGDEVRSLSNILTNRNIIDPGHDHLFPPRNRTVIFSQFESIDGWQIGGTGTYVASIFVGGISLATGASTNDDIFLIAETTGFNSFDVTKPSAFQTVLKFSSAANITAYWGVGDITDGGAFGGSNDEGYGFKYINGTLSAVTIKNGTETATVITGITATNFNEYRAVFSTSEDGQSSVHFYVNGVLATSHGVNLPNTDDDVFATYYVKTTTTAAKTLFVKYNYFVQVN